MNHDLEKKLQLLREANTESMPHSERGLLDHLLGTRNLLLDWGERSTVCDAGLFHSVYGTEHYQPTAIPLSQRNEVRNLIGEEAEALAYLFCTMRREDFDRNLQTSAGFSVEDRLIGERIPLTTEQFHDLVTMTFANTLEAYPRLDWGVRRNCRAYLQRFEGIAKPAARNAFAKITAPRWRLWK